MLAYPRDSDAGVVDICVVDSWHSVQNHLGDSQGSLNLQRHANMAATTVDGNRRGL